MSNKNEPEFVILETSEEFSKELMNGEEIYSISEIDLSHKLGELLMAAIVRLSTEVDKDKEPDEILQSLKELVKKMYYDEEKDTGVHNVS